MSNNLSKEDVKDIEEQIRKLSINIGEKFGWGFVEDEYKPLHDEIEISKANETKINYIESNFTFKRNETKFGSEKIETNFYITNFYDNKDSEYMTLQFRPKISNAEIVFNSIGFNEADLNAHFSKSKALLGELFTKDYLLNNLFDNQDAASVFNYYNFIFDEISKITKYIKHNNEELTEIRIPYNFPTYEEFLSENRDITIEVLSSNEKKEK